MADLGERNWPVWNTLQSLSLYHEPNRWQGHKVRGDIHSIEHDGLLDNDFLPRFIEASRKLQVLTMTGTVTAFDFFMEVGNCPSEYTDEVYEPPYYFPNLIKLALWEPELGVDEDMGPQSMTEKIIEIAAQAALQMPKLRVMELWNARGPYIFCYEVALSRAIITIKQPELVRDPTLFIEWKMASHHHPVLRRVGAEVDFKFEKLEELGINEDAARGEAIFNHLRLSHEILDPRSHFVLRCRRLARIQFRKLNNKNDEAGETDVNSDDDDDDDN